MKNKTLAKAKAIEYMNQLEIYQPFIDAFREDGSVCFFEGYGGYWLEREPELYAKKKAIEREYDVLVYAITHTKSSADEMWSFLVVTDHKSEWKTLVQSYGNQHRAFAYVWNKDDDWCSEFGSIVVQSFGGGIRRVA